MALAKSFRKNNVSSEGFTAFFISTIFVLEVFLGVEFTIGKGDYVKKYIYWFSFMNNNVKPDSFII